MKPKTIFVTQYDLERLERLLEEREGMQPTAYLDALQMELDRAQVVAQEEIPSDVITMNSKVSLVDVETSEEEIYTLVFPEQANAEEKKISIMAPLGTAMLGYRVGDTFEWQVPKGTRRWRVAAILYQPEAAGDFHL